MTASSCEPLPPSTPAGVDLARRVSGTRGCPRNGLHHAVSYAGPRKLSWVDTPVAAPFLARPASAAKPPTSQLYTEVLLPSAEFDFAMHSNRLLRTSSSAYGLARALELVAGPGQQPMLLLWAEPPSDELRVVYPVPRTPPAVEPPLTWFLLPETLRREAQSLRQSTWLEGTKPVHAPEQAVSRVLRALVALATCNVVLLCLGVGVGAWWGFGR